MIKFITGNKWKFKEMSEALSPIKIRRENIDLEEIQELDPYKIIEHKLKEAFKHENGNFFVEDTSNYYKALGNKLPGPLAKWFITTLGPKRMYEIAAALGNTRTSLTTIIAYAKDRKNILYFEATTHGNIVKPKGKKGFGFDPIFKPNGSKKTLAELKEAGLTLMSARAKAALKLKKYLLKNAKAGPETRKIK